MRNDSEDLFGSGEVPLDDVCLIDSDESWMLFYLYKTGGKRCADIVLKRYVMTYLYEL